MDELQEIKQMVRQQMEADGFMRPTILLVDTKSRLGVTFTSLPGGLDAAVASAMHSQGVQIAIEHPEVGHLVRAYFATIAILTPAFFSSSSNHSQEGDHRCDWPIFKLAVSLDSHSMTGYTLN